MAEHHILQLDIAIGDISNVLQATLQATSERCEKVLRMLSRIENDIHIEPNEDILADLRETLSNDILDAAILTQGITDRIV